MYIERIRRLSLFFIRRIEVEETIVQIEEWRDSFHYVYIERRGILFIVYRENRKTHTALHIKRTKILSLNVYSERIERMYSIWRYGERLTLFSIERE